jgi:hypothetical protein
MRGTWIAEWLVDRRPTWCFPTQRCELMDFEPRSVSSNLT